MSIEDKIKSVAWGLAGFFAAVLIMGVVGERDYEDAEQQDAHFCKMVSAGHWPNYRKLDCSWFEFGEMNEDY